MSPMKRQMSIDSFIRGLIKYFMSLNNIKEIIVNIDCFFQYLIGSSTYV